MTSRNIRSRCFKLCTIRRVIFIFFNCKPDVSRRLRQNGKNTPDFVFFDGNFSSTSVNINAQNRKTYPTILQDRFFSWRQTAKVLVFRSLPETLYLTSVVASNSTRMNRKTAQVKSPESYFILLLWSTFQVFHLSGVCRGFWSNPIYYKWCMILWHTDLASEC